MRFSEIHGQERALSLLRRSLRAGRLHHAYLFEGPPGVGKERTATALAARLLCEDDPLAADADACGRCRSCRALASGAHPDFHLIERGLHRQHPDRAIRASKGLFLVVDVVRHFLIEPAGKTPALGRRRVFVVRDAERMNEEAQNALLKTLEEPPGPSCLVLVSSSSLRLLPTIRSRCQQVCFDLLPRSFIREQLAERGAKEPDAELLSDLAQGSLGAALRWHAGGLLDARQEIDQCLAAGPPYDAESFAKALVEISATLAGNLAGLEQSPAREADAPADADDATRADPDSEDSDADAQEAGARRASGRRGGASKAVSTDQLRDSLRLSLMLVSSLLRQAMLVAGGPSGQARPARSVDALGKLDPLSLADAIESCGATERILERNVAPQLALERLAVALGGVQVPSF